MKLISRLCKGLCMTFSMFTVIPCPGIWDAGAVSLMLPLLPVIGAVIGALWYGFSALLELAVAPVMLRAALVLLFPLFMSGFIHMDGFMDTCDAIFSRTSLEKKRDILKDPHVGAFAVIALCSYLMLGFAAIYSALERGSELTALFFAPALTRCVAAVAALNIKPISENGYVAKFKKNSSPSYTFALAVQCVVIFAAGVLLTGAAAVAAMLAALSGGIALAVYSIRQLDGISGDLCGFIITGGELCALLAVSVL